MDYDGGNNGSGRRNAFHFDFVNECASRYGGEICDFSMVDVVGEEFPNHQIRRTYQSNTRNLAPVTIRHRGPKRILINNRID